MGACATVVPVGEERGAGGRPWAEVVPVPGRYKQRGATIEENHLRAISIKQLDELGELLEQVLSAPGVVITNRDNKQPVTRDTINMYHINDFFVKPLTEEAQCSFVELIASGQQIPKYFVSHSWRTSYFDTIRMLKLHAKQREISVDDEYYWICVFANNQHKLDIGQPSLMDTPFARAIMLDECQGTVSLLDEKLATPFTRIWCIFENFVTLTEGKVKKENGHFFDFATIIPANECEMADDRWNTRCAGLLFDTGQNGKPDETTDHVDEDGNLDEDAAWFPSSVAEQGFKIDVRNAEASSETDRRNILALIAGREDEVNALMRKQFARSALYQAASKGNLVKTKELMESEVFDSEEHAVRVADEEGCVYDCCEYEDDIDEGDQTAVIKYLLNKGCSPNNISTEPHRRPALKAAFIYEAYSKVKLLLKHGADPLFVAEPDAKGRPGGFLSMEDITKKSCPKKLYKQMLKLKVPWQGGEGPKDDSDSDDDDSDSDDDDSDSDDDNSQEEDSEKEETRPVSREVSRCRAGLQQCRSKRRSSERNRQAGRIGSNYC